MALWPQVGLEAKAGAHQALLPDSHGESVDVLVQLVQETD